MVKKTLDETAIAALMSNSFNTQRDQLELGVFDERNASRLYRNLLQIVHTSTQFRLARKGDTEYRSRCNEYWFDGPIPGAEGQAGSTLQYVAKRGQIFCAKISEEKIIRREFEVATNLHEHYFCPTLLRVEDFIKIREQNHSKYYALITPFYPRSLAHFVCSPLIEHQSQFLADVLICGLASIQALYFCGKCHGDLKYDTSFHNFLTYSIMT